MEVLKIGGAVLKNRAGFLRMVEILKLHTKTPTVLIVSAFSNATRRLATAAEIAESGDYEPAIVILDEIILEHTDYARELFTSQSDFYKLTELLAKSREEIAGYLRGLAITKELTPRTNDLILSFGELFALHTVSSFLQEQGFEHSCIDAKDIIVSDSKYGAANPNYELTKAKMQKSFVGQLEKSGLVLTQGFVASSSQGEITTMGMESSNLTAVLIAAILEVKLVTFWTDVEGIRSADPKICSDTDSIQNLNYSNAYKTAMMGLKLIHPAMVAIAEKYEIELVYRSAFNFDGDRTIINSLANQYLPSMLLFRSGLTQLEIDNNAISTKIIDEKPLLLSMNNNSTQLLTTSTSAHQGSVLTNNCTLISIINFDIYVIFNALGATLLSKVLNIAIDARRKTATLMTNDTNATGIIKHLHDRLFLK